MDNGQVERYSRVVIDVTAMTSQCVTPLADLAPPSGPYDILRHFVNVISWRAGQRYTSSRHGDVINYRLLQSCSHVTQEGQS